MNSRIQMKISDWAWLGKHKRSSYSGPTLTIILFSTDLCCAYNISALENHQADQPSVKEPAAVLRLKITNLSL